MLPRLWRERWQGALLRRLSQVEQALERVRRRLLPPPLVLFRDVTSPWLASALCLAARLKLADAVGERGETLAQLADANRLPAGELARLLAVLQAHGYFRRVGGMVKHTSLSRALQTDVGGSFAELQGRGWYREAFHSGQVLRGWREGVTPFQVGRDQPFFDFLASRPEAERLFSQAMADVTRFCAPFLAAELRFEAGARVLDVGGGDGVLASALLERHRFARLAVLDRAAEAEGGAGCQRVQGDFFQQLPSGFDHLLLKNILHDWPDESCLMILARCREAVSAGDRLTVIECLLPETAEQEALPFALDWNVGMTLSGRERTRQGYEALLSRAGWRLDRVRPTATPYRLLEATAI